VVVNSLYGVCTETRTSWYTVEARGALAGRRTCNYLVSLSVLIADRRRVSDRRYQEAVCGRRKVL